MQELIDRNKGDERLVARLQPTSRAAKASAAAPAATSTRRNDGGSDAPGRSSDGREFRGSDACGYAPAAPRCAEEALDEETQRYIAQALTDVDLFSSYGLTQKATHLLENVLERAPRHTPTLERLLDMYLGAGNERRTAELAAQLEQIHRERGDTVNAERFAELRQRFQKAGGNHGRGIAAAPPALSALADASGLSPRR